MRNPTDSRALAGTSHNPIRGRFAPTPSGRMHLGNVWCALLAWLDVRSQGGELVLRIEDLDPARTPPGAEDALINDLRWLGLDWDEGPLRQSERTGLYQEALKQLTEQGLTYPCFCSRADLHAAQAPHASDGTTLYAGTCRGLSAEEVAVRSLVKTPGIRLRVPSDRTVQFTDGVYGPQAEHLATECGDFLVRRSDGVHAYQLAVVVDDALMGVNRVVRGRDLLGSTARQLYLQELLGFDHPTYAHVPLLMASDGSHRLSKRERDCDLGYMRERLGRPEVLLGKLAQLGGLRESDEPVSAEDLVQEFSWDLVRAHPKDRRVPTGFCA